MYFQNNISLFNEKNETLTSITAKGSIKKYDINSDKIVYASDDNNGWNKSVFVIYDTKTYENKTTTIPYSNKSVLNNNSIITYEGQLNFYKYDINTGAQTNVSPQLKKGDELSKTYGNFIVGNKWLLNFEAKKNNNYTDYLYLIQ